MNANNRVKNIQKIAPMEDEVITKYSVINYLISDKTETRDKVQIIELLSRELKLVTLSEYSKQTGISYNGAKNFRNHINIGGKKFINNESI